MNRAEREILARKHTREMQVLYDNEINASVKNTKSYNQKVTKNSAQTKLDTKIFIIDSDSVKAAHDNKENKTAILNFASYRNPGGGFINGSIAQEESLCHASFLYNVLLRFPEFYGQNKKHLNRLLYSDRALYSEDILFQYNREDFYCDVITCAAPNKSAAQKNFNITDEKNTEALRSRVEFILDIAVDNKVETLILGAFGCGVFGQEAAEVSNLFKQALTGRSFSKVVFAIPSGNNDNLQVFQKVFNQ